MPLRVSNIVVYIIVSLCCNVRINEYAFLNYYVCALTYDEDMCWEQNSYIFHIICDLGGSAS